MATTNTQNGSSFENALDKMIESSFGTTTASASIPQNDEQQPKFIAASSWQGPKTGYYFGTSDKGTGYYWDAHQQQNQKQPSSMASTATTKKRKRVMIAEDRNQIKTIPPKLSGEDLLKEAEEAVDEHTKVMELTVRGVHAATTGLQKVMEKNSLERVKYKDDPTHYMDSELALHEQISSLKAVAANPVELYRDNATQLSSSTVPLLAGLLSHENSDIASSVMNVFVEWLDPTLLVENASTSTMKDFQVLAKTITEQCLDMIIGNLGRFTTDLSNTEEEGDGDQNLTGAEDTLTWIEHMLELDTVMGGDLLLSDDDKEGSFTSVASKILTDTLFLSWLLPHATDSTSSIQGRAAEVLSFLLQHEDAPKCVQDISHLPPYESFFDDDDDDDSAENHKKKKGKSTNKKIDGMELILQTIASWRKKQPSTEEECEILENLCLTLASCMFSPKNVEQFLEAQGPELVLRCLKERVHAGGAALKVLDFMGSDPIYKKACEQMVEAGGLKYIFPIFMGRSIPKPAPCSDAGKKKISVPSGTTAALTPQQQKTNKKIQHARKEWLHGLEDNTIRIVYSLTRHIHPDSPNDAFERLLVKFLEADCEKCDRLVELCLKYDEKSRTAEYNFYRTTEEEDLEDQEGDAAELAALNAKLKGGGDLFHRVGAVAAFACVGSKRCHNHVLKQLTLQKSGIGTVKASLEEFAKMLGTGSQKDQLDKYLSEI